MAGAEIPRPTITIVPRQRRGVAICKQDRGSEAVGISEIKQAGVRSVRIGLAAGEAGYTPILDITKIADAGVDL